VVYYVKVIIPLIALVVIAYLITKGGLERAGYQLGAFVHQVVVGYESQQFEPKAQ
jgi:hypothetical protein